MSLSRKQSSNLSDTASVDSDSSITSDKENEKDTGEILEILSIPSNRKFFLDNLLKSKDPSSDTYEIRLKTSQFNILVEVLLKIIKGKHNFSIFHNDLIACVLRYHKTWVQMTTLNHFILF